MQKTICFALLAGVALLSLACEQRVNPVARGKFLATIGGCGDCHTPKVMDPAGLPRQDSTRLFAGHPENAPSPVWSPADMQERSVMATTNAMLSAWAGPWGVSYAANLTPDTSTGLGEWTEQAFIQAMRTGKHQGQSNGRDILPPMPWENMTKLPEQDLQALWAYLRSIPPVHNQVPLPLPPAPMPAEGQ